MTGADARALLAEAGRALDTHGTTGLADSAPVFDAGSHGLDFFAAFTPAYNACVQAGLCGGSTVDHQQDIVARYDEHREINFGRLYAEADRLDLVRTELTHSADRLDAHHTAVSGLWRGAAAESGIGHHAGLAASGRATAEHIGTVLDALTSAVSAAERVCHTKAAGTHQLHADQVGGLSADQIESLIAVATKPSTDAALHQAAGHCGIHVAPSLFAKFTREQKDALRADIGGWLSTGFAEVYQSRKAAFDQLNAEAREGFAAAWQQLDSVIAPAGGGATTVSEATTEQHSRTTVAPDIGGQAPASAQEPGMTMFGGGGASGQPAPEDVHRSAIPLRGDAFDDLEHPSVFDPNAVEDEETVARTRISPRPAEIPPQHVSAPAEPAPVEIGPAEAGTCQADRGQAEEPPTDTAVDDLAVLAELDALDDLAEDVEPTDPGSVEGALELLDAN